VVSTAVAGLQTVLGLAKEVAGPTGVPGLQAGIGSLLLVLDVIKKTYKNADDAENLVKQIKSLTTVLENARMEGTLSREVIDRMDRLSSSAALQSIWVISSHRVSYQLMETALRGGAKDSFTSCSGASPTL